MADDLEQFLMTRTARADRPLVGVTVLVVEDSRFACEAMRLLCLRSGARIRRADSLASARRHLNVYRPTVVMIDLGLPDGSGLELIEELNRATPRVDAILAISGDDGVEATSKAAGADAFLAKPISNLGVFQAAILGALPNIDVILRGVSDEEICPDEMALHDDLEHAADLLTLENGDDMLDYIAQFLAGVARSSGDGEMAQAAKILAASREQGTPWGPDLARVAGLVQTRLEHRRVV
ncbi:KDP operon transcriptional regulatory protein KdpE [Aquimixticola soesokkakensis]|uniref:KDP operon transcriptional regulatory protein KdpE n=1 Tax=Aquimixticola soesokkakensis TaxID=1519096 RepID=A0A1Y5RRN5_9RHOB|nr:response regulator [Aquimixticola soesokkakensis]SLN20927.1 KDP operon transcriptional regulatory protein KdpE [Aquimixticola soesokkakensis]